MKNKETIDKLELMEGLARRCICYVQYFYLTSGHPGKFWPVVQNAVGEAACLFWSHLFGNKEDDFHYSKFFSIEEVAQIDDKFSRENIKARLIDRIGMNESEYEAFWKEVKSCRDKFVAHRDSNGVGIIFPRINLCREMAEELRDIFFEIICAWFDEFPNDVKLEGLKKYYEWNPNRSFEAKCARDFENGIVAVSKNIG